jgi:hypothetical protein
MATKKKGKLKKAKPTKRYLITKHRDLKKHWRGMPKDEKSEFKRLLLILAIIFVTLAVLYYVGVNLLTNIGGFWSTLRGEGGELFKTDAVAPPPPYLSPLPLYTNSDTTTVEGYAEAGAEVTLFVNGGEVGKTIAEKGGQFSFASIGLNEGENTITATAKDGSGNESLESSTLNIVLDKTPPELIVQQPSEGQSFSGEDNRITVSGSTESGAVVKVNDSQISVLADGSFSTNIVASTEGNIKIVVVATDRAGNESKVELTVSYSAEATE